MEYTLYCQHQNVHIPQKINTQEIIRRWWEALALWMWAAGMKFRVRRWVGRGAKAVMWRNWEVLALPLQGTACRMEEELEKSYSFGCSKGHPIPSPAPKSWTSHWKEKKKRNVPALFCSGTLLYLEIDFQWGPGASKSRDSNDVSVLLWDIFRWKKFQSTVKSLGNHLNYFSPAYLLANPKITSIYERVLFICFKKQHGQKCGTLLFSLTGSL